MESVIFLSLLVVIGSWFGSSITEDRILKDLTKQCEEQHMIVIKNKFYDCKLKDN